jgi:hypothetical protein
MHHAKSYTIETGGLASNGRDWKLRFDESSARSEAVHVNLLGYVPSAPQKFAYVFHMDDWYNGKGRFNPGIIPYGPWR